MLLVIALESPLPKPHFVWRVLRCLFWYFKHDFTAKPAPSPRHCYTVYVVSWVLRKSDRGPYGIDVWYSSIFLVTLTLKEEHNHANHATLRHSVNSPSQLNFNFNELFKSFITIAFGLITLTFVVLDWTQFLHSQQRLTVFHPVLWSHVYHVFYLTTWCCGLSLPQTLLSLSSGHQVLYVLFLLIFLPFLACSTENWRNKRWLDFGNLGLAVLPSATPLTTPTLPTPASILLLYCAYQTEEEEEGAVDSSPPMLLCRSSISRLFLNFWPKRWNR